MKFREERDRSSGAQVLSAEMAMVRATGLTW